MTQPVASNDTEEGRRTGASSSSETISGATILNGAAAALGDAG
jgi:hypothetical protein